MNLLNELKKTALTNAQKIIQEQEFILLSVKENLSMEEGKDLEMLKHFGTHKILTDAKQTKKLNLSFINGEYLSEKDIKTVCNKYALKCLPTYYYQNRVPMSALNDMRKFEKDRSVYLRSEELSSNLFIIAPKNQFALTDRPKDPVLLYKESPEVYRIISSWGNDFNFLQRIKGWICYYQKLLLSLVFVFGTFELLKYSVNYIQSFFSFLFVIVSAFLIVLTVHNLSVFFSDEYSSSYKEPYK